MKPLVRILIVTDDYSGPPTGGFLQWRDQAWPDAVNKDISREFHLGEFIRVLQDTNWVGFNIEITRAHRAQPLPGKAAEAALKAQRGADVVGFRFNLPFHVNGESRTLADYDMVLFFPVKPSNADLALKAEAYAIARFMEDGGGFFATGDHENLGGELAPMIPRVGSMRRWYFNGVNQSGPHGELPAPPALGPRRHDTTRKGADNVGNFEDQSDEIPQDIAPSYYAAGFSNANGYVASKSLPHPLLCSPDGPVTFLPDHMHEGTCEVPGDLANRWFALENHIPQQLHREYPDYVPPNAPPGAAGEPLAPEIVATGSVLPNTTTPALDTDAHVGSDDVAQVTNFGVICAWDGHRVNRGRVVVDSTWHHFFNINLTGDRYLEDDNLGPAQEQKLHGFYVLDGAGKRVPCDAYKMIQWYYRNIVYWLIPAKRTETIWWNTLYDITRLPRLGEELAPVAGVLAPEEYRFGIYLYFGQLAEEYLARARGACAKYEIHRILYKPKIPWFEWVEQFVDVWTPPKKQDDPARMDEVARMQLLGAWGVGPKPETTTALTLGAAVLAVAEASRQFNDDPVNAAEVAQKKFSALLNHALGKYVTELERGAKMQRRLMDVIAEQLGSVRPANGTPSA
jgi:hypothetical protein